MNRIINSPRNGVYVFTVKTDAFVLRSSDLEKAHELIEFDNGFGIWRKAQDNAVISPSKAIQHKQTLKTKLNH